MAKTKTKINPRPATIETLFNASLTYAEVDLPDGTTVWVREMTAHQNQERFLSQMSPRGKVDTEGISRLSIEAVYSNTVTEDKKRMFNGADHLAQIGEMGNSFVDPIAKKITEISGIKTVTDGGELEEWLEENHPNLLEKFKVQAEPIAQAKKNSVSTQNGASPTD